MSRLSRKASGRALEKPLLLGGIFFPLARISTLFGGLA